MIFNHFFFRISLLITLIVLTSLALAWTVQQPYMVATSSGLGVLILIEALTLFHFLSGIKRDVQRFTDAIRNEDTSLLFNKRSRDHFLQEIHRDFNEIIQDFRLVRKEKELEHQLFRNTVEHINIGLMVTDKKGKVRIINQAFRKLFHVTRIPDLQHLSKIHKDLPDLIHSLENGSETSLRTTLHHEIRTISIRVSTFKLENQFIKLVSFQDISKEINRSEIKAWQKLIRVMRHEIMNSISPIRIMSGNLLNLLQDEDEKPKRREELEKKTLVSLSEGLHTIRKRSMGLSDFVDKYRDLTKLPDPTFVEVDLHQLIDQTVKLFETELKQKEIRLNYSIQPHHLKLTGDEKMLEQVLINIIKNAIEAIEKQKKGKITLSAAMEGNQIRISIRDNGMGIPGEDLDNIFTPFYSTKEKGSGIGLSFSRQIMQIHDGTIQVQSEEGIGTEVLLIL